VTPRRLRLAALVLALAAAAGAAPLRADDIPLTKAQGDSILVELRAIRQLLAQQGTRGAAPAPPADRTVTLPPVTAYELGRKDAPLTLVEFADYECPYCRQFHTAVFEKLKREWIEPGKLRFISRDLPLDFHPHSFKATVAARCAGATGKFWELREVMLVNSDKLELPSLVQYAADLGVDTTKFAACVRGETFAPEVRKDMADAGTAGITGTPTFVLGKTSKQGVTGTVIIGAMPYADLDARLKKLLATK